MSRQIGLHQNSKLLSLKGTIKKLKTMNRMGENICILYIEVTFIKNIQRAVLHWQPWQLWCWWRGWGLVCGAWGQCRPAASALKSQRMSALVQAWWGRLVGPSGKKKQAEEELYFQAKTREQLAALKKHDEDELIHHKKETELCRKKLSSTETIKRLKDLADD